MTDLQKLMRIMQVSRFTVPSFSRGTKQQNCENSKQQEWKLVCQLNDLIMDNGLNLRAVLTCDVKQTKRKYDTGVDLRDGDIYIYETVRGKIVGNPIMYIDVKIAFISEYRNVFATITRRSFDNFANKAGHYYWCFNMDSTRSVLIDTLMFYKIVNNNNPWNVSKKFGCADDRNEDYIMGKWINQYRQYFEVHV